MNLLCQQLLHLGLNAGDAVMVHSSFRSLGLKDPELIIQALCQVIGSAGTLLMPALSYLQVPPLVHNTRQTPTCVGFLSEYFRQRPGTRRSVHPTHSVCAIGMKVDFFLADHIQDQTPCGRNSPFNKLFHHHGKILMLGCGLKPNTTMHAIEEYIRPPYLFGETVQYTITDDRGITFVKDYIPHNFQGVSQRYDRVEGLLGAPELVTGLVGSAQAHLIDSQALYTGCIERLHQEPCYFVDFDDPVSE